jgi:hypothetical protein
MKEYINIQLKNEEFAVNSEITHQRKYKVCKKISFLKEKELSKVHFLIILR